jgi:hypothetical protein
MDHHHTKPSENEFTHQNTPGISLNRASEEFMKKTRKYEVGIVQEAVGRELGVVRDNVLNDTYSGIDLPMVRSLLCDEHHQAIPQNIVPFNTDTCVTIECVISNENVQPLPLPKIHETADFSMLETIQSTGNVSSLIGNVLSSHNMEFEGMRNPADYSGNSGSTNVAETGEAAVSENLYETSSHVFDCYIENDSSGMHNNSDDLHVESTQTFTGAVVAEERSEGADSETKGTFFGFFQKNSATMQEINKSIRQLVEDYPLISEHELFEQVKGTGPFLSLKLNKKRLMKLLGRLKLGSGYERFRYFVKA